MIVTNTLTELDTLSEESYKDSTLIMQLLRDNLVSVARYVQVKQSLTFNRPFGPLLKPSKPQVRQLLLLPPPHPLPRQVRRRRQLYQPPKLRLEMC